MIKWAYAGRGTGIYSVVWGLALLAWILFADSLAEAVMVGVIGFVFCWYGVGVMRTGSWSLR